ncbi:hypothetical protein [Terrisporobacter glycolicus]|uniref:DUF4825 domain-containing protein n=1 Tax=Terrisporobacter glycolicus ATCC 14880 = DSM 1288 TaxID=1121315 RepID=A0ABZ2ETX6_9FIRM|nr:hypothetical protein [Terrisporobacter glycolicus]
MKKRLVLFITFIVILLTVGCSSAVTPKLHGFYQSDQINGHFIQLSFQIDDNTFVEYIDNIEVNKGTYENLKDNTYELKGNKRKLEIKLEQNNSFNLNIHKINNGNIIEMKKIDDIPTYFKQQFSDKEKEDVKDLLN